MKRLASKYEPKGSKLQYKLIIVVMYTFISYSIL